MRALVISDIHANLQALEAVLAVAPPHDAVWNLGDVVGYGANPNEVIERVRQLGGVVLRGNHDRACAGLASLDDFSDVAAQAVRWTQRVLTQANREWLHMLPAGPVLPHPGPGPRSGLPEVGCVHGSPLDEDEYIFFPGTARVAMEASATRITFFGHTHRQGGFASNDEEDFPLVPLHSFLSGVNEYELPVRAGARYLLNPGSVGQPRDGDRRAAFAVYDDADTMLRWCRVDYDIAEAQRRIRLAGLPDFLAERLEEGR